MTAANQTETLTTPQAAQYLGISRQLLTRAAHHGELGRQHPVQRRMPPYVWLFTRAELDRWNARERSKGERPRKAAAEYKLAGK